MGNRGSSVLLVNWPPCWFPSPQHIGSRHVSVCKFVWQRIQLKQVQVEKPVASLIIEIGEVIHRGVWFQPVAPDRCLDICCYPLICSWERHVLRGKIMADQENTVAVKSTKQKLFHPFLLIMVHFVKHIDWTYVNCMCFLSAFWQHVPWYQGKTTGKSLEANLFE